MRKIICLLGDELTPELEEQLLEFDGEDVQIHLVSYIVGDDNFCPPSILSMVEEVDGTSAEELMFCSDLQELCEVTAFLYGRIFKQVIWLESGNALDYAVDEIYSRIMATGCPSCADFSEAGIEHLPYETDWTVYYQIEDAYFVFEPIRGERIVVSESGIYKMNPPAENICYMYPYFEETLKIIQDSSPDRVGKEMKKFSTYCIIENLVHLEGLWETNKLQLEMFMLALEDSFLNRGEEDIHYKLLCSSFLAYVTLESRYYDMAYRLIYENKHTLTLYNQYYLWRQLRRYSWRKPKLVERQGYSEKVYEKIYTGYELECQEYLKPIPKEKRDENFIVVLGIQFLSEMHAPTRTILERCVTLADNLGKRVLFINTREQITTLGLMPVYAEETGNVAAEYNEYTDFTYKGCTFEFYQCKEAMPEFEETKKVLDIIRTQKPYMILSMGAGSIVSDLVANIVPVINFPMVFSTIVNRKNQFSSLGRSLSNEERKLLQEQGYNLANIIEGTFTFDIKEQKEHFTRQDFALPEEKFLLLVVGLRLHAEIDEAFIHCMSGLYKEGIHLVFVGYFDNYDEFCMKFPEFKEHSSYLGYQKDILAVNELTDLYINPRRLGGGFSIAEAFAKGKPGVTINCGDVAATAGPGFCVGSYDEMAETIRRYCKDKEFYKKKSQEAVRRLHELTDSGSALRKILEEAEKRKGFF